ncbi:MAG TPA: arginase family protein [Spirochaetia bacterium]|nr:arginase family protein [Spirochaetia bacterium]
MRKLNLFVPQWQDSGHSNEIFHGSSALRRFIGAAAVFEEVHVDQRGELRVEKDIFGHEVILDQLQRVRRVLDLQSPEVVFTLGGGCGVEVSVVSYLKDLYGDLDLFWFDAHGDINSPATSRSKYFHGMPLRFLVERFEKSEISALVSRLVPCSAVTLLGTRDLDDAEEIYLRDNGIELMTVDECGSDAAISKGIGRNPRTTAAYIHIDLDTIDPSEFRNVKCPARFGLSIARIARIVEMIREEKSVVGISILENMETEELELQKLQALIDHATGI